MLEAKQYTVFKKKINFNHDCCLEKNHGDIQYTTDIRLIGVKDTFTQYAELLQQKAMTESPISK